MDHPILLGLLIPVSFYIAKLWREDALAAAAGKPNPNPLPGATAARPRTVGLAVAGALALVALETWGEVRLGIAAEQSRLTWLFALYSMLAAPVLEELIFRGWIVIEHRGQPVMWAGVVAASIVFALLHPFLWQWGDGGFALTLTAKGWFSSSLVFATSIWLYLSRLAWWNPTRSLLPCFVAHAARNMAVVAVKAATGYMGGLW
jgi:uncharacterized protein